MVQTKKCLVCGKTIIKLQSESQKWWNTIRKYCSRECNYKGLSICYKENPNSGIFKKGHKTWNKGIEYIQIRGENHWNWQSGKAKIRRYKEKHLSKHPYANKWGYVPEHRLVMERKLGRYLSPQEVVHHINGQKKDNRSENLILFSSNGEHVKFHHNSTLLTGRKSDPRE